MQVLDVKLTFGEDEANMESRTLDISVDNKYPLQFSIANAKYDINSFEQNTKARLQLKSITPTYSNEYYTGCAYNVHLYFKFPPNTFPTSDKNINLTFEEYNKKINNSDIEFISETKEKEKIEKKEQTDKNFSIIIVIIIGILILRHFDLSVTYKSCVKKCLKEGIIYHDGWKMTRYNIDGPLKFVKTYRFTESKEGNEKDYLYYRKDRYSPEEIYRIVNGKEIFSYQITTYKERVKREVYEKYIKYSTLAEAVKYGMPDKLEYTVIWLRQKIYYLKQSIAKGPKQSGKSWHGPYGWQYHSTEEDISNFTKLKQELKNCNVELHNLEMQKNDSNKNQWYWIEIF